MTPFQSVVVLKRSRSELWNIMRDHLVDLARSIEDVERVEQIERTSDTDGIVHIVNKWQAQRHVAASIQSFLPIGELSWIDRNRWDANQWTCTWTIEPAFLSEYLTCSGQTSFVSAIGGRGTRVTFAGELDLKPGWVGSPMVAGLVESILTTTIPRNLRAVAEAAATFDLPT
jgi:hypothetical protein